MEDLGATKARGRALLDAGDHAGAIAAYEQARAQSPDDVGVINLLGYLYFTQDRFEDARACCLRAIELEPDDFYAHKGLGLCLWRLGDAESGIAALRRSIEIKPDYFDSRHDLGVVLAAVGRVEEAKDSFAQALAIDPTRATTVRRAIDQLSRR